MGYFVGSLDGNTVCYTVYAYYMRITTFLASTPDAYAACLLKRQAQLSGDLALQQGKQAMLPAECTTRRNVHKGGTGPDGV